LNAVDADTEHTKSEKAHSGHKCRARRPWDTKLACGWSILFLYTPVPMRWMCLKVKLRTAFSRIY
jgi:hypothetical protein